MSTATTPTQDTSTELPPLLEPDDGEFAESVLKWVWLSWMIFGLSLFLPAMSGVGFGGRMWTVPGWQIAMAAQNAVWDAVMGQGVQFRRIRPFTQSQAMMLAIAGTISNWMVICAGLVALSGSSRPARVLWANWACAMALVGLVVGAAGAAIVVFLRPTSPQAGIYAWLLAQFLLTWGLWRVSRYNRPE